MCDAAMGGVEKRFTLEELKKCDGKDGRPAYVAYKGKVYDVGDSFLWVDGDHQGEHEAGEDLTEEMAQAPHGEETLERVKLVGVLVP
jgi:predicted heme/steroid binding protein